MKFFVDTADVAEIREIAATGLLDGVTTNPSLVAKSGRDFSEVIKEICDDCRGSRKRRGHRARNDAMIVGRQKPGRIAPTSPSRCRSPGMG